MSGFAPFHGLFVLARLVGGMAVGAASVLSPAYIAEVAPAAIRGRLATMQQVMIITGLTTAFVVNYVLAQLAGASTSTLWGGIEAWRWMHLMQAVPAAVFLVALLLIPESPRYLVSIGRDDEAARVLRRLFGDRVARTQLEAIRASFGASHRPRTGDLIDPVRGGIRPIVWAGLLLAVFQQLVGINVIFYYGATLWQLAGFAEDDALMINVVSGVVSILACFVTVALVDRLGRKPLLLVGSAGMAATLFGLVFAFGNGDVVDGALRLSARFGAVALVSANLYVIFFNGTWGPVMWVMLGEMFPNRIRGSALAVCGFAVVLELLVAQSFPTMAASLGLAVSYSVYAVSAVISFFLVKAFVHGPGAELEEMEG